MKKIIYFLLVFLFPSICLGQQISDYSKEFGKKFFPKQKIEVINDKHPDVLFIKSGDKYFAVAMGQSISNSFARQKARPAFLNALRKIHDEQEIIVTDSFISNDITFEEKRVFTYIALYSLEGDIRVNGKPIDIQKIISEK